MVDFIKHCGYKEKQSRNRKRANIRGREDGIVGMCEVNVKIQQTKEIK